MQGLGVKDDSLAKITKEEMLDNLRNDVESYTKALETARKDLANYKEQADVDLAVFDLLERDGAIDRVNPEFVYQTYPEWKDLAMKKQLFKHREQRATIKGTLERLETMVKTDEEALKNAQAKLKKFQEEQ